MNRREFLGAAVALSLEGQTRPRNAIQSAGPGFRRQLAERELLRGLMQLGLENAGITFSMRVEPGQFHGPEEYAISAEAGQVALAGASEQALLYSVFDFLERQGAFFGIDGESYPLDPVRELRLPARGRPWTASPRFAVRGLLPWPDFLNCITVYNEEDFRVYFESMLRMRFNTFGMHVYTGASQWAESYLSFEYGGAGHLAYLDTTASNRWGYLPERTSRFTMGAAGLYAGEVFGSDATRLARDPWEAAERARDLLQNAFAYAERLGIRTGIGFEPYQIPDEIWRALPPEVRPEKMPERHTPGPRFDIESVAARDLLEARLAELLETYPGVEYVWLWEDEQMNWDSRKTGEPLSATPFLQAHDFLRRHAPKKRLVLSGWGGVARHFVSFHERLPGDVIFSCLGDSLGWDPVHEVFGKLEGRERWPIPWLEDDPSMWLPQFHVYRFERDLNRAADFGCQGLLGIHWRHRIVDPTAGFQARFSWDGKLAPAEYYRAYAGTQAAEPRAGELARVLGEADRDRKLLDTFTGEFKDGHAQTREFSGDYGEAFAFWSDYQPEPRVMESQKQVAAALARLADSADAPLEREHLGYLAGHIHFLVPYAEAWTAAHQLHKVLKAAADLKKGGHSDQARDKVRIEGVPLWLRLAPEVRRATLDFQRIVATRNDLGTLASMHNKFVRLALVRLRLSMKEYLGELPPETESLLAEVTRPDQPPPRLFLPTRPGILAGGEQVRLSAVFTTDVPSVTLHTRLRGSRQWTGTAARREGRNTWNIALGPFPAGRELAEYYVSAGDLKSPRYFVTLV
jgi:hypothetical protein